jgi:hypothetical protein
MKKREIAFFLFFRDEINFLSQTDAHIKPFENSCLYLLLICRRPCPHPQPSDVQLAGDLVHFCVRGTRDQRCDLHPAPLHRPARGRQEENAEKRGALCHCHDSDRGKRRNDLS